MFEAAARRLTSAGVRCPELLLTDHSRALYPADIAVVEDVAGGSLEALLEKDPVAAGRPLSVLADWLKAMADVRSPSFGKVAFVDAGGRSHGESCEMVMPDRALAQLAEISARDRRAAAAQVRLEENLRSLTEPIMPRVSGWRNPPRPPARDRPDAGLGVAVAIAVDSCGEGRNACLPGAAAAARVPHED